MSKISGILNIVIFTVITGFSLPAMADGWFSSKRGVAPVNNVLYKEECGACHFAFQPGLLPARSWILLMKKLSDHFGDNAEVLQEDAMLLTNYLIDNAADKSTHKRSVKINRSISPTATPLRITKTGYIIRKHDELSRRHVVNNPKVGSLSKCEACHTRIDSGSFSEREIKIPGFGQWEDD